MNVLVFFEDIINILPNKIYEGNHLYASDEALWNHNSKNLRYVMEDREKRKNEYNFKRECVWLSGH